MNKKKSFAPHHHEPAELQFFASLPLEDAAESIRQLSTSYNVAIAPLDEDAYSFEIYQRNIAPHPVFVKGVMRRWEGTYTRLDCKIGIQRDLPELKNLLITAVVVMACPVGLQIIFDIQDFIVKVALFILAVLFIAFYAGLIPDYESSECQQQRKILLFQLHKTLTANGLFSHFSDELNQQVVDVIRAENHLSQGSAR